MLKDKYRFTQRKGRAIQVMFRHIPGKWISTGCQKMKDAVLFAENYLANDGIAQKDLTLRDFARDFFREKDPVGFRMRCQKRNLKFSDHYFIQQQRLLDNYILPKFGDFLIAYITDVMIEDWILNVKGIRTQEIADATKNKILQCFRTVLQEAKRKGLVSRNEAQEVQLLTVRSKTREPFNKGELTALFPEDRTQLLYIWNSLMWAVYFLILRDTGFRPGEAFGLTIENYIPGLGLYTTQSVANRQLKNSIKTTKKGQDFKVGILTNQTEMLLRELINTLEDDFLFTINGRLLINESANKHLKLSAERAGVSLNGRTQYSLRHSFETDLAGKIPQQDLLLLMAHTKFRKEYDHRTPEDILEQLQPVKLLLEKR